MGSTLANYFTIHNEAARSPLAVAHKEGDDQHYWEEDIDEDQDQDEHEDQDQDQDGQRE